MSSIENRLLRLLATATDKIQVLESELAKDQAAEAKAARLLQRAEEAQAQSLMALSEAKSKQQESLRNINLSLDEIEKELSRIPGEGP